MTVDVDEPDERQNFSIAHEVVHTFFRDLRPYASPSNEEERLCDIGAAELTMPAARFGAFVRAGRLCFATIDELHEEFAVSFEAAARRTMQLTDGAACLFVAALVRTERQERFNKGTPALRITKWTPSSEWPNQRSFRHLLVATGSLLDQAFINQDERSARADLGIKLCSDIYDIEVRGYSYPRPGDPLYRQVLALAQVAHAF